MNQQFVDKENESVVSILLVEDDDGDAKGFKKSFEKAGISNPIIRVVDGIEALKTLRGHSEAEKLTEPYVIISDINMPRMNGIEFISKLREDPDLKKAIVFMLTTSKNSGDIDLAYLSHIAGYICKDSVGIDFVNLIDLMKNYWNLVVLPD